MNKNEIIIPARLSYAHVWEPKQINGEGEPKYSVCCLVDKNDRGAIKRLLALIEQVKQDSVGKWGGKIPAKLKSFWHDGDADINDEGDPFAPGNYYFNTSSSKAPKIIDARCNPIIDQEEVYSGCYANVKISVFAFNHPVGGKGISAGLVAIQKTKDGEHLGGSDTGTAGFDVVEDDDAMLE